MQSIYQFLKKKPDQPEIKIPTDYEKFEIQKLKSTGGKIIQK